MRALAIAVVLGGVALGGVADAGPDWRDLRGGAWLHYELTDVALVQERALPAPCSELVLAGARLHGFVGTGRVVAYHAGIDLAAGATIARSGFAYDVALFPLGIGLRASDSSFVALGTGVGAMGAVGTLDDAVTLPIELTAELGGGRLRVLGRARVSYVTGAPDRHDGAPSVPFGDELEAMLGLRIGHHYEAYGFPSGNGYFVAASYRELMGARYVGLTIGYSIDLGTPRGHGIR